MSSFKESANKLLSNMPDSNFFIERNGEVIGEMQGLPITNTNYIHTITLHVDISVGDCLSNKLGQKFLVEKTEMIQEILRIYYSKVN